MDRPDRKAVDRAFLADASGYVTMDSLVRELIEAIRAVNRGETFVLPGGLPLEQPAEPP